MPITIHIHHHYDDDLHAKIDRVLALQEQTMSAIDDLNAAVADISADVSQIATDADKEIAALTAALAANDPTAVNTAVGNLKNLHSQLQATATKLEQSVATP